MITGKPWLQGALRGVRSLIKCISYKEVRFSTRPVKFHFNMSRARNVRSWSNNQFILKSHLIFEYCIYSKSVCIEVIGKTFPVNYRRLACDVMLYGARRMAAIA